MAAEDDGKTEDPTGKRVSESRNKGMVGKSGDFQSALVLMAGTCLIWMFADHLVLGMRHAMVESFMAIGDFESIPGKVFDIGRQGLMGILLLLMPVVATLFISSIALAIIARVMPSMNVWMVGMPMKLGLGLLTLIFALPLMWQAFLKQQAYLQQYWIGLMRLMGSA